MMCSSRTGHLRPREGEPEIWAGEWQSPWPSCFCATTPSPMLVTLYNTFHSALLLYNGHSFFPNTPRSSIFTYFIPGRLALSAKMSDVPCNQLTRVEAPVSLKAYIICAFAAFGGIFFGYDSGYINGVLGKLPALDIRPG